MLPCSMDAPRAIIPDQFRFFNSARGSRSMIHPGARALAGYRRSAELAPVVLSAAASGLVEFIGGQGGDVDSIFGNCGIAPEMTAAPDPATAACHLLRAVRGGCAPDRARQFRPVVRPAVLAARSRHVGLCLALVADAGQCAGKPCRPLPLPAEFLDYGRCGGSDGGCASITRSSRPHRCRRQDAEFSLGQFTNIIRECCGRTGRRSRSSSNIRGPLNGASMRWRSAHRSFSAATPIPSYSMRRCWTGRCRDATSSC